MLTWFINLQRRHDRYRRMLAYLHRAGVPIHTTHRLVAKDRDAYTSVDQFRTDAAADGFPCFHNPQKTHHKKFYGYIWSYLRALRDVANQKETVLLMEDDTPLGDGAYNFILKILEEIPCFEIAVLQYNQLKLRNPTVPYSQHWLQGTPANGTSINVYKPSGAQWLLETVQDRFPKTPETCLRDCYTNEGLFAIKRAFIPDVIGPEIDPELHDSDVNRHNPIFSDDPEDVKRRRADHGLS